MNVGSIVVVYGKLDGRVRDQDESSLTIGTLEQVLIDGQVSVLLPDGTIWVGSAKEIGPVEHQE